MTLKINLAGISVRRNILLDWFARYVQTIDVKREKMIFPFYQQHKISGDFQDIFLK